VVKRLIRLLVLLVVIALSLPVLLVALYAIVPPPLTPLMALRWADGAAINKTWTPLERIAPAMPRAVIASEDNLFCEHSGFDWNAIGEAADDYAAGKRMRGASTISMQVAKNLFLWPGRDFLRKGVEAYITVVVELLWSKRRIMEVYLNIAEWGDGLYGIGAASQAHFRKAATALTPREAALLAAVLPNPREWSPNRPTDYIAGRADVISRRVGQLGPMLACVDKR
jgi:monofunctional biosynthetic peptidoglycan transglycosylase